jgi:hypothetical protein
LGDPDSRGTEKLSLKETENSPGAVTDSPNQSAAKGMAGFRRSRRVRFEMPVKVYVWQENAEPIFEVGKTLTVSAHGALLILSTPIAFGDKLRLINPRTQKEIECHACRFALRYPNGVTQVGVEFAATSQTFWDVESPPKDWDPAWVPPTERKREQRPVWSAPASVAAPSEDIAPEQGGTAAVPVLKRWRSLLFPTLAVVGLLTLGLSWMVSSRSESQAPAASWIPASQRVAPEDAGLISDSDNYRVATTEDFAHESVSWLSISGQQASGDIPGAYAATGSSHAYVLIGKDSTWRVIIVANGQVRCDDRYQTLAIVAHLPKNLIQKIDWSDRPAGEPDGDGLLIVRAADNAASSVVLFLQGDQAEKGIPFSYYEVLKGRPH